MKILNTLIEERDLFNPYGEETVKSGLEKLLDELRGEADVVIKFNNGNVISMREGGRKQFYKYYKNSDKYEPTYSGDCRDIRQYLAVLDEDDDPEVNSYEIIYQK